MPGSTFILCPSCDQEVSSRALRCNYCGELLRDFRECPHCAERVRARAQNCRYCGQALTPAIAVLREPHAPDSAAPPAQIVPQQPLPQKPPQPAYLAAATPLGALFCHRSFTGLVMAPELFVSPTDIEFHSWSLFGLRSYDQKIPISRITSVRLVQGIFWGSIVIETFGGPVSELELRGMNKREAQDLARIIDEYVHAPRQADTRPGQQETA